MRRMKGWDGVVVADIWIEREERWKCCLSRASGSVLRDVSRSEGVKSRENSENFLKEGVGENRRSRVESLDVENFDS